jgi:hypothetical protein
VVVEVEVPANLDIQEMSGITMQAIQGKAAAY